MGEAMGCCCSSSGGVHDPNMTTQSYKRDLAMGRRLQAEDNSRRRLSSVPEVLPTVLGSDRRHAQDWGAAGGKRLGGGSGQFSAEVATGTCALPTAESMRRRAAEAAELRQMNAPGIFQGRAAELRERQ